MLPPFGFSVGDFISAIELVSTVINSLKASGQAGKEYSELLQELYTLERALQGVKQLNPDDFPASQLIALRLAASSCQTTIDKFWKHTRKYQACLQRHEGVEPTLRQRWMKIRWAVCHKDDIAKFKTELVGHSQSISMLLLAMQMTNAGVENKRSTEWRKSLVGNARVCYTSTMQKMCAMADMITIGVDQGRRVLTAVASIAQTNWQMFQLVIQIHEIVARLPAQVERQQPVTLEDPFGRIFPFHLEFIQSVEALKFVLADNCRQFGAVAKLIDWNLFEIWDSASNQGVNIYTEFFSPGQRVFMSIVICKITEYAFLCPRCERLCEVCLGQAPSCWKCGILSHNKVEIKEKIEQQPDIFESSFRNILRGFWWIGNRIRPDPFFKKMKFPPISPHPSKLEDGQTFLERKEVMVRVMLADISADRKFGAWEE